MHAAETIKGVVTTAAAGSWIAWVVNSPMWSTVCMVGSLLAAGAGWWIMRKEKQAELARNKRVEDAMANMQINDIVIAQMINRLLHPELKQEVPKQEIPLAGVTPQ